MFGQNVDYVTSNAKPSHFDAKDDYQRQKSDDETRALDWLFERINLDPQTQIKYVDTKNQLADILTKGSFSGNEWNHLLRLFNIMSLSMFSYSQFSNILSDLSGKQSATTMRGQEATPLLNVRTNELGHLADAPNCASVLQPALRVEHKAAADAPEVDTSK